MKNQVIVLGAGLSGLSIGYLLKKKGFEKFIILEKDTTTGGLCRSFNYNGHIYDIGGHILFSKNAELLEEMIDVLGDNKEKFYRNNAVWYKGQFVKYPFENGMGILPIEERYEILISYLQNGFKKKPSNFGEWMYYTFGKGLTDKYLMPYNKKIWKRDPYKMDMTWVERVPKPPVEDMVKAALGIETEGYVHQLHFYYPKTGGIQALTDSLSKILRNHIKTTEEIKHITKDNGKYIIETDKEKYTAEKVVSTIPVLELPNIMTISKEIKSTIDTLEYNAMKIAFLTLKNNPDSDHFAVYVPDDKVLFHRMCFTNYVKHSPKNEYGVMMEITYDGRSKFSLSNEEILKKCKEDLIYMNLAKEEDFIGGEVQDIPYGYVVYDIDYPKKMNIINKLNSNNFYLAGRFGSFRYLNMDAVFDDAKKIASKIENV